MVMKRYIITLILALAALSATAQPGGGRPAFAGFFGPRVDTVKIWPDGAPNAYEYTAPANQDPQRSIANNYTEAIMEVYPARNPNGQCIIMCPGGGYAMLSLSHEARNFKDWFNARGITYCVLLYRMPRGHHDVPLSDIEQAIRIMRGRTDLGITSVFLIDRSEKDIMRFGKTFFASGAISDRLLKIFNTKGSDITLIARDFTKMFLTPEVYTEFIRKGNRLLVLQQSKLIAITLNPTSPQGYLLDSKSTCDALSDALGTPVYDVKKIEQ